MVVDLYLEYPPYKIKELVKVFNENFVSLLYLRQNKKIVLKLLTSEPANKRTSEPANKRTSEQANKRTSEQAN